MPHAGLMDEKALDPEIGLLLRARLHIRGGRRRLRQGKTAAGIVTLYDALLAALEWYVNSPSRREDLVIEEGDDLCNERDLFSLLSRSGIVTAPFDFAAFDGLVERALSGELPGYDYTAMLSSFEQVMVQLGVMPFDEGSLPPEDPATY